ncbi:hypothetical protein CPB85DRAFT_1356183 [Mucidula mucida]|nr:hypothetical protein CPB85DRAFT_1356183 [Mucidula mucida]
MNYSFIIHNACYLLRRALTRLVKRNYAFLALTRPRKPLQVRLQNMQIVLEISIDNLFLLVAGKLLNENIPFQISIALPFCEFYKRAIWFWAFRPPEHQIIVFVRQALKHAFWINSVILRVARTSSDEIVRELVVGRRIWIALIIASIIDGHEFRPFGILPEDNCLPLHNFNHFDAWGRERELFVVHK